MSKANKLEKKQSRLNQAAYEAKQRKSRDAKVILALVLCAILIVGVFAIDAVQKYRENSGSALRAEVAAYSENFEVDGAMMNYFYNSQYNSFLNYYGSYISYIGLDPTVSLRMQYTSEDQTETWFEYIMNGAIQNVDTLLTMNEAALAEGISLTEAEKAAIKARTDELDAKLYGKGVKNVDIYNASLIEALAYKYQLIKQDEITPNLETIEKRFADASNDYMFVDTLSYSFEYEEETEESAATGLTKEEAKALADKIAAATDADSFTALVKEAILEAEPEIPEEDLQNRLDALASEGVTYASDDFSNWAFADDAVANSTFIKEDTTNLAYTVYLLNKAPYRAEGDTKNVRHILFTDSAYGDDHEKALAAAEDVLAAFNAGNKTEEDFALLALQYSDDTGSCYSGGLYNNVASGEMVEAFDAWCFDEARVPGETEIIETEYGIHIMYFVSEGLTEWQASVSNDILNEALTALSTEWQAAYTVDYDTTVFDMIPG